MAIYSQNDIPECPHCGYDIPCDLEDGSTPGIQHISLRDINLSVDMKCDECCEDFTVMTLVTGKTYEVSE